MGIEESVLFEKLGVWVGGTFWKFDIFSHISPIGVFPLAGGWQVGGIHPTPPLYITLYIYKHVKKQ